ncbi:MAG: DUF4127 family protein [Microcystis aeruginosa F13-15]|jgi:hypothetical protein|nr:DUF4127 family protein [Microcystis aeruginosa F13-15]
MMTNQKLKALVNTVIKQSTLDGSQITDPTQKFSLIAGGELEINSYQSAANNHWQLTLTTPVNGVTKWFAYKPHLEILTTALDKIKTINAEFPNIGVYHRSNDQDRESAGSGRGIFPSGNEPDHRSETTYLPFVMATRRQTDMMARQAYLLLPESIRKETAFKISDRLIQSPEEYIPYIEQKKQVVLIGSFMGLKQEITSLGDYQNSNSDNQLLRAFHNMELRQLEYSIDLVKSLNKPIIDIVFAIGDSPSKYADEFRSEIMEKRLHQLLGSRGLAHLKRPLTWGADDTTLRAFARQLPNLKLKVITANSQAKHHYDGYRTTEEIVKYITQELGITIVNDDNWDAQVFIFDRHPQASYHFGDNFNDTNQKALDQKIANQLKALPTNQQSKTIIIDGRNPNGAFNSLCIPPSDKFLAFGGWGTFGNVCAQTLAMAKILHFTDKPNKLAIQRQLLLEAVAHDVFIIGYEAAQSSNSPLRKRLAEIGGRYLHKECKDQRYKDDKEVQKTYQQINRFVNEQMSKLIPEMGSTQLVVVPQLWRTFESQVFVNGGELSVAGVYHQDLPSATFNPFQAVKNVKKFGLDELLQEF